MNVPAPLEKLLMKKHSKVLQTEVVETSFLKDKRMVDRQSNHRLDKWEALQIKVMSPTSQLAKGIPTARCRRLRLCEEGSYGWEPLTVAAARNQIPSFLNFTSEMALGRLQRLHHPRASKLLRKFGI